MSPFIATLVMGCSNKATELHDTKVGQNLATQKVQLDPKLIESAQQVRGPKDILAILTVKAPQLAGLNPTIVWNKDVGMYEMVAGLQVVYVDKDGKNIIQGHVINIDTGVDYTDLKIAQVTKIDTNTLNLKYAIKVVNGNGSNVLYIFSSLDDNLKTYYKSTLSQLNNTTVYYFINQSPELTTDDKYAVEYKAKAFKWVYCSDNPSRELENFLGQKTNSAYSPVGSQMDNCEASIMQLESQNFARKYKIVYTPTLFTVDGNRYQPQNLKTLQDLLEVAKVPVQNQLSAKDITTNSIASAPKK